MRALATIAVLIFLPGCATSPSGGQGDGDANVITREQIVETGGSSIYDVVRQLRRGWLPHRPGSFIILADENRHIWGRIDADQNFEMMGRDSKFLEPGGIDNVQQLEWMSGVEARGVFPDYTSADLNEFLGAIIMRYRQE